MRLSKFQIEFANECQRLNEKRCRGELTDKQFIQAKEVARKEIAARLKRERKAMKELSKAFDTKLGEQS